MISICNILPNNKIDEQMPRQRCELYLTHQILKEPQKFEFLNDGIRVHYKILDNSACELGEGLDFGEVLKAADIIAADEVVLPDIPRSSYSLSKTMEYLKDVPTSCKYKLAAVVQGDTFEEVMACSEQILFLKRINTIMIPKWYCQMNSTNGLGRHAITKNLLAMMQQYGIHKEIHWLGMDIGMREIITPLSRIVRSIDTGYFAALSTPQWKEMQLMSERPRELKINLDIMDVDMDRWMNFIQQQNEALEEITNV